MSEKETETVTTEKPKNPGRQEWGRKLGKMQKELKLKKQKELSESTTQVPETDRTNSSGLIKWEYALTGLTIIVGIAALYYQKKSYECQLSSQKHQSEKTNKPVTEKMRFSAF